MKYIILSLDGEEGMSACKAQVTEIVSKVGARAQCAHACLRITHLSSRFTIAKARSPAPCRQC